MKTLVITIIRKPLDGTIAQNCLAYGSGALNIDNSRVGSGGESLGGGGEKGTLSNNHPGWRRPWMDNPVQKAAFAKRCQDNVKKAEKLGRFPANLVLTHQPDCECIGVKRVKSKSGWTAEDGGKSTAMGQKSGWNSHQNKPTPTTALYGDDEGKETVENWACVENCPAQDLDEQSGVLTSGSRQTGDYQRQGGKGIYGGHGVGPMPAVKGNSGGASRFFKQFQIQIDEDD